MSTIFSSLSTSNSQRCRNCSRPNTTTRTKAAVAVSSLREGSAISRVGRSAMRCLDGKIRLIEMRSFGDCWLVLSSVCSSRTYGDGITFPHALESRVIRWKSSDGRRSECLLEGGATTMRPTAACRDASLRRGLEAIAELNECMLAVPSVLKASRFHRGEVLSLFSTAQPVFSGKLLAPACPGQNRQPGICSSGAGSEQDLPGQRDTLLTPGVPTLPDDDVYLRHSWCAASMLRKVQQLPGAAGITASTATGALPMTQSVPLSISK